jgi:hypothetical protein
MMDLDFTGVESFANIPLGVHAVTVKEASFTKAKNTHSDQLEINFEDAHGATKKMWCSLVPQALWKVKSVLEALGIPCEGKIRLNTKNMIGKHCVISVEVDPNDASRNIVTRVMRSDNVLAEAPAPEVPFNAIPSTPFVQPTPTAAPAPASIPVTPAAAPISHSEPVSAPAQTESDAPQGNMPPWMQSAQNTANSAPQGNLPPWMRPKQ